MEPVKETRACPYPGCGQDGVALVTDNSMVTWCEAGHVTIFEDTYKKQTKRLVYTFGEEA